MAEVIWSPQAIEDVEAIARYIESDSPFQARRVAMLIMQEARRLQRHPRCGSIIPERNEETYRELRVFSYRLLYRVMGDDVVHLLAVVHGKRLFDSDWLP